MENELLIVNANEVNESLKGKENEIIDLVSKTYLLHNDGYSSLPHSIFLRFPERDSDRIIGLPAHIGGDLDIAGMKWISSFPENTNHGIERASAVTLLNSMKTGQVTTILEGSIISAKRTAASAALAAKTLHANCNETKVGIVGCGRINYEILKYISVCFPKLKTVYLYDQMDEHAEAFTKKFADKEFEFKILKSVREMFENVHLISFATTAGVPYINDIDQSDDKTTILNISLRDFSPEVVEKCHNIVDDLSHVSREKTSIDLTQKKLNSTSFVSGTLADVIIGKIPNRASGKPVLFSPFGLGILDLALAHYVENEVRRSEKGIKIHDFFKY